MRILTVPLLGLMLALDPFSARSESTLGVDDLPAGLSFEGELIDARRWKDGQGLNHVLLTRTVDRRDPELNEYGVETYSARLHAYHYLQQCEGHRLLRRITDFVEACDMDMSVAHVPGSLAITDLDGNGLYEVTFLYELACRSDVSPLTLKLMMLDNGEKYPIRGTNLVDVGSGQQYGGEKHFGAAFDDAPASFRRFADQHWDRFVDSTRR